MQNVSKIVQEHVQGLSTPVSFHRYCCYCLLLIDNESLKHCQNICCNKELTASNVAYFLKMNVSSQLQSLFNGPGFIREKTSASRESYRTFMKESSAKGCSLMNHSVTQETSVSSGTHMVHLSSILPNFRSGLYTYQSLNCPIRSI